MSHSNDEDRGAGGTGNSLPSALSALIREIAEGPRPDAERRWEARLAPGVVIGRFELVREVGRGGFGIVYEALDRALGRTVAFKALKVRTPSAGPRERVLHEAEVAAGLSHPNIATLFDLGQCDEGPFLVFEFLRGQTLKSRLKQGRLPITETVRIALEAARGIACAHSNGVVHRDLTPANVFLCTDGQVKILDLGMAHAFGRRPAAGGTPGYMAPEQVRGGPEDERTDVFGLGVLLYRMVTGDVPFPGGQVPSRAAPVLDVPGVPGLGLAIAEMLAIDPVDRPRDGGVVVDELTRIQRDLERAPPADPLAVPGKRRPRTRQWKAGAALAAALVAGVLAWTLRIFPARVASASDPPVSSIAVLPFADLSQNQDQQYFSDGLSEEILGRLSRIDGLRVPGRTSSFRYRSRVPVLADLGKELGVAAVLDGSTRIDGNRVRVSAQVVAVADGYPLWSSTYDRELKEIFAVQDEIAHEVAQALRVRLLPGGSSAFRKYATTSPEAYRAYLRARENYYRYTVSGLREAVESYQRAIDLDPGYAPAWAGIAIPLHLIAGRAETREAYEAGRERARAAAEKAVALAPDLPDALSSRALLRSAIDHDWEGARVDLERAIALNGGDPDTRRRYAVLLGSLGRLPEAIEQARIAADLDPHGPSLGAVGMLLQAQGDLGRADAALRQRLRLEPGSLPAILLLGQNLLLQGRYEDALATFASCPDEDYRLWGTALAAHSLGRAGDSSAALVELTRRFAHVKAFDIAVAHAWRGEREEAFAWLDRAREQDDSRMSGLLTLEPLLASLRDDPRYGALLARMNLPAR